MPKLKKTIDRLDLPSTPSSAFLTLKLSRPSIDTLVSNLTPSGCESLYLNERSPQGRDQLEKTMRTRGAWSQNLSNIKNQTISIEQDVVPALGSPKKPVLGPKPDPISTRATTSATPTNQRSILKRKYVGPESPSSAFARQQTDGHRLRKRVQLKSTPTTIHLYSQEGNEKRRNSEEATLDKEEVVTENADKENVMSQPGHRPSLKLKLSKTDFPIPTPNSANQTPNPQSAVRTPSIKLNFGKKPSISGTTTPVIKKDLQDDVAPSSGKKRKRTKTNNFEGSDDELAKPPPPQRRLTLKTSAAPAKTPVTPGPVFRLKTKGKIPKRQPGVGYDSELEDREPDPVILEGLILRMLPGPDCDYLQKAITDGTIGVPRASGGANVHMRFLDTNGRRGIMQVNGHLYATSVVDLPCIIEGMKSWDKKGWIKSIDICQMMLVLGPCGSDDEAKNYALPPEVDPKTYAYAHGLTAPMKWVRKRRFARTRRARVDDIESIERKVNALLEADLKAQSTSFQVFDRDPRIEQDQYSEVEDEYEDDDAEGEFDDSYFPRQDTVMVETPGAMAMDAHVDQDQIDDIEAMFMDDDEDVAVPAVNGHNTLRVGGSTLHPPDAHDSSVAVTSASASPSASAVNTAAPTPAGDGQQGSSDEGEDEDEDGSDRSDSEKDADDNLQQVKDRIVDMENKIREQTELLKRTANVILKKKIARKIGDLRDDVRMMKAQNGLAAEDDGDDGDE